MRGDDLLIRADNWRWRYAIARTGRYPEAWDISRDYWPKDRPLPSHGDGGYPYGYLEVIARDSVQLSRNTFIASDCTICATCAENCRPDIGSEWGYLPLFQTSLTGNEDMRPIRCDRCNELINDYETLQLVAVKDGETETEWRYASGRDRVIADAEEWRGWGYTVMVFDHETAIVNASDNGESWDYQKNPDAGIPIYVAAPDHAALASLTQPHIAAIAPYNRQQLRLFY